jgi:hypothetical protein
MNIFEKDALAKADVRTASGIVSVWASFRDAIHELLGSYNNQHPDGEQYPAKLKRETDTGILIECVRGQSAEDPFSALVISVRAHMEQKRLAIECRIERWTRRLPGVPPSTESVVPMCFVLDSDNESLLLGAEKLSPFEAAEKLLGSALLN